MVGFSSSNNKNSLVISFFFFNLLKWPIIEILRFYLHTLPFLMTTPPICNVLILNMLLYMPPWLFIKKMCYEASDSCAVHSSSTQCFIMSPKIHSHLKFFKRKERMNNKNRCVNFVCFTLEGWNNFSDISFSFGPTRYHIGLPFQKSEDVYQRQVLSISCIIFGIVIVGMFCAAFYFKSKKQAKQIQEQLKESQNGKNYSLKASSTVTKSESLMKSHVQLQSYSKADRHPVTALEKIMESSFASSQSFPEIPSPDRGSQPVKHHSPGQRSGMLYRNTFRRTPPSPRSRLGGSVGPAYQQLEESRIPDQDTIPCQGIEVRKTISHLPIQLWCVERPLDLKYVSDGLRTQQNASINMQLPSRETNPYFNSLDQKDMVGYSSPRANSVPIIPSMGLEETCMQMPGISEVKSIKWCKNSYSADIVNASIPVSDRLLEEQQEVKILLETVQEQIRILTDARRSEEYELASVETEDSASENTAFLPLSPTAKSEREAQFVLRNEIQRDSVLTK
ncbi:Nrg3 [Phodopus roborovskii]|uniref:Nrg3 protein n=1 Tax=Phodopus roborovskii TaxID=109678 RepID=A0AAV0A6Y9_PHORO|nr:Nrg3 [Phodopus roborovskii]